MSAVMTNVEYDAICRAQGFERLCGVDEAGRGPLAGPVYAAAVILDPAMEIPGLDDSKKLSEKRREALYDEICEKAAAFAVACASVEEIEALNILQATFLAMRRAADTLTLVPDMTLIDGNRVPPGFPYPAMPVVKGDALSAAIAAASILAKVSRDRYMREMDRQYPLYRFAKHKGYGTPLHVALLREYGPSPIHRMSFLSRLL